MVKTPVNRHSFRPFIWLRRVLGLIEKSKEGMRIMNNKGQIQKKSDSLEQLNKILKSSTECWKTWRYQTKKNKESFNFMIDKAEDKEEREEIRNKDLIKTLSQYGLVMGSLVIFCGAAVLMKK